MSVCVCYMKKIHGQGHGYGLRELRADVFLNRKWEFWKRDFAKKEFLLS